MNRYDLMEALNQVDEAQLEAAERFFESGKEPNMKRKSIRTVRIVLIAAVITALLGVTAYAAGIFGLRGREVAPEETFPMHFGTEWDEAFGAWKGTYALEFESPETCRPVRYRFGWLPEDLDFPCYEKDAEGWVKRWDWMPGSDDIPWAEHVEAEQKGTGLFFISDVYYTPQFVNGGALLLLNEVPEEITEETWGELSVLRFRSSAWRDWRTGETGQLDTSVNHVLLFHPEQGWILSISGTLPMEELVQIAQEVEIEQTEGLVEASHFENSYALFDAGQG